MLTVAAGVTVAQQAGSVGTYNLSGGGTLSTQNVSGGAGTSTFNFDGGTLQASNNSTNFLSGLTTASVLPGGAIVDTNGFAVTVSQNLSSGATNDGGLTKNGVGTLTLTGASTYAGNTTINAGSLVVTTGGSFAGNDVLLNAGGTLAVVGSGRVNGSAQSIGPLFNVEGDDGTSTSSGTAATITVADNAVVNAGPIFLGTTGRASLLQTGGTVTRNELELGTSNGSTGTYALSAGTLTAGNVLVGDAGTGVFDQTGGTVDAGSNPSALGLGAGQSGTCNLSGGTLVTIGFYGESSGMSVLNFNGGTLRANGSTTMFLANQSAANVLAGGARIDTAGNDVTVDQQLLHGTAAAIDGGLTKLGTGTVTLTAANLYTGGTNVSAGAVRVNNTSGSGTGPGRVKVVAGATLGGTGTITGDVTLAAGATMTAGADDFGVGTLTTNGRETWAADATGQGTYVAKTTGSTSATPQATDLLHLAALTVSATPAHPFVIDLVNVPGYSPTLAYGQVLVLATDTEAASTNPFGPANRRTTLMELSLTSSGVATFDSPTAADRAYRSSRTGPGTT